MIAESQGGPWGYCWLTGGVSQGPGNPRAVPHEPGGDPRSWS